MLLYSTRYVIASAEIRIHKQAFKEDSTRGSEWVPQLKRGGGRRRLPICLCDSVILRKSEPIDVRGYILDTNSYLIMICSEARYT